MKAWNTVDQSPSQLAIKNIAICMYGQYRTGDACLEYIKKFYNVSGVNVDFFCSLKPYETTYTRHKYNAELGKDLHEQEILTEDAVKYQTEQITKHYNPKKFKIYTTEYENQLADIGGSLMHSKVLAGWVDSVMLKQQHEAENDITYDLVIMQRYDTIVWPSVAFGNLLNKLQGLTVSHRGTLATGDKHLIFYQPIEFIRQNNGTFMYPNGQDLWVIGIGTALDTLVYDALEYIPSKHKSNYAPKQFHTGYPHIDTHEMLGSIVSKMNIPRSMFPSFAKTGEVNLPLQKIRHGGRIHVSLAPIVIRDVYWEDGVIPNMADLSDNEIEKLYDKVILKKWEAGH